MNRGGFIGMAVICGAVAVLAAVASALGVFVRGDGTFETVTSVRGVTYEMATTGIYAYNAQRMVAEGVGWDIFTLFVAVPAMVATLRFVAHGSFRGRLFALGLLAYFFYQYLEYALGWAFGPLFPLFVVISAVSLAGLVWLGVSIAREGVEGRFDGRFPARPFAVLSVMMAGLLTLMWAQRIAIGLGGDLAAAGLQGETTLVVQALDLGLVVPAALFIGVLAWRRSAAGKALAAVYVVGSVGMAAAILGMVISAGVVEGSFEIVPIAIFAAYVVAGMLIGLRIYRSAPAAVLESHRTTEGSVSVRPARP
jgi:hypothetical protein